jgi:hypothetical protein
VISRTWTAIDQAGNSTNALQIITVRDTTPPTITCKPDRTIQPGVSWAFDEPSVSDTCSAVILQVLSSTTNNTGTNVLVATRTWEAMDACGNSSTCQQTITINLGVSPIITSQPANTGGPYLGSASMAVGASGTGPLSYQWRKNGGIVAGATSSLLSLNNLQFTNAGLYSVVVSNAAGTAVSSEAILNVAPHLDGQSVSNMLKLTWPAPMILQMATNVAGPYIDVPGAVSPYFYSTTNKQSYFRLRSPPFSLLSTSLAGGQFQVYCPGVAGCNFIVQGSTNMINWVNLQTNTSPFTFVDSNAWQYPTRFYRAILAH